MDNFDQQLVSWQPFFMTMAAVSTTLAGLLFLALSLHFRELAESAKVNLKRLAQHTFVDFLQILFMAIVCLIPHTTHLMLGLWLLFLAAINIMKLWKTFAEALRDKNSIQHRRYFLSRIGISLFAQIFIIIGSAAILRTTDTDTGISDYLLYISCGSIALLASAMRNAWFLLVHELG